MTLSELGTTLRTEREQRGLSLDDVAQRLRISLHVLQSLEDGDANALPHKAYAKGFIRSYATLLGLASDEVDACVASLSGAAPSVPQPIATLDEDDAPRAPTGKMLAFAIVLLLLAGGGYAVWHFNLLSLVPGLVSNVGEKFKTAQPLLPETAKSGAPAQTVAVAPKAEQKAPAKSEPPKPAPAASEEKPKISQERQPEKRAEQKTEPRADQPAPSTQKQTATSPVAGAPVTHHKIIVMATEDCWIQSNADQSNARQFSLRKGDTFALTFAKSLEVKLGNAAAVRIRYNGNELPQVGKPGEARTLVFPMAENQ